MKLAFICNEYPPAPHGGIGTFVQTVAHAFRRKGHTVTVVGWGDRAVERDDDGVRVVTLGRGSVPRISWLVDRIRLHRWLKREVGAGRCDLIETPDYEGALPFAFRACPVVVRLHLSATAIVRQTGRRPRPGVFIAEYFTLRSHRRWIGVSDHAVDLTVATFALTPEARVTIYCPIVLAPAQDAAPADLPDQFVLFAGYVCARKGAYDVARAARLFLGRFPDLHVVFLGELSVEDGIRAEDRIRTLVGAEYSGRVHCYGRVGRAVVAACMSRARAFVYPSHLETLGLVVGEAMLSGLPVVTSTCPPFPEYLSEGETGLMVPPDDAAALSGAVCRLIDDAALASRVGTAGRHLVADRFSLDSCIESSEQFYRASLERQQMSGAQQQ
jgi:glycosyltransferase involved in cell wall biosynthesis